MEKIPDKSKDLDSLVDLKSLSAPYLAVQDNSGKKMKRISLINGKATRRDSIGFDKRWMANLTAGTIQESNEKMEQTQYCEPR